MRGRGLPQGEQRKQIEHALQASLWQPPQLGQGQRAGRRTREAALRPQQGEEGSDSGSVLKVELLGFWKRPKAGRSWGTATPLESGIARVGGTGCMWEGPGGPGHSTRLVGQK